jgi:hypothetical protein
MEGPKETAFMPCTKRITKELVLAGLNGAIMSISNVEHGQTLAMKDCVAALLPRQCFLTTESLFMPSIPYIVCVGGRGRLYSWTHDKIPEESAKWVRGIFLRHYGFFATLGDSRNWLDFMKLNKISFNEMKTVAHFSKMTCGRFSEVIVTRIEMRGENETWVVTKSPPIGGVPIVSAMMRTEGADGYIVDHFLYEGQECLKKRRTEWEIKRCLDLEVEGWC